MFCTSCGKELAEGSAFCTNCGAAVGEETPVVEVPAEEVPVVEAPVEEVPVVEVPAEEVPVVEAPVEEVPVVEAPVEEVPVVEVPVEEDPVVEVPVMEAPVEEAPAEETAVAAVDPGEGMGKASFVLGIISLAAGAVCSCIAACLGGAAPLICGIVGIVLSIMATNKSKAAGFENKKAKTGLILSIAGIAVILVFIVINAILGVGMGAIMANTGY